MCDRAPGASLLGANDQGQVGNGSVGGSITSYSATPTTVVGFERAATSISLNGHRARGSVGTEVRCWGNSGAGYYLGDGSTQDTGTPVVVQGL